MVADPKSFKDIFDVFWHKMDNQYVYWDTEETNWDAIYTQYRPLFENLSFSDPDRKKAAFYFRQMTSELEDGHYRITFNNKPLLDSIINPSIARKSLEPGFHAPYNYSDIVTPYLDKGYYTAKGSIINDNALISLTTGTIKQNLLYFNCNFFSLNQSQKAGDAAIVQGLTFFFSKLNTSGKIQGIIIDLRNNYGGDIGDLNYFAGKLVTADITFGYIRSKSGLGHNGYLPWIEAKVKHDPLYQNQYPIVILTDSFTASLCETIILALKADHACTVVGEVTYGATGPLSDPNIFNSGSFDVGAFMKVETSAVEFKTLDNQVIESKGIKPDVLVPFNIPAISQGKDLQLEAAIRFLNSK
ncbi:S41 family peptidase [Mucilaginibacter polytrichastri]|nr:S41 family peptidase [Mucilaginibacter polytrichastri]